MLERHSERIAAEAATTYGYELRKLLALALPNALVSALRTAQFLTDQAIVGHLAFHGHATAIYLDSAALALLWMQLTMAIATRGIGGAINTLASQAFGASKKDLADVWLLSGAVLATPLFSVAIAGLWLLTGDIVAVFAHNQSTSGDEVSSVGAFDGPGNPVDLAAKYARLSLGMIVPTLWMECLNNWLLAQGIIKPQLAAYCAAFILNLGLNFTLVHGIPQAGLPGLGFVGSPLATTSTRVLQLLMLITALPLCRIHLPRPRMHEVLRLSRMRVFLSQMLPRSLSSALEELALQTVAALAAHLGAVPTATHNAMLSAFFWLTAPMYGIGSATQQRMGAYLGAGRWRHARVVAIVCFIFQVAYRPHPHPRPRPHLSPLTPHLSPITLDLDLDLDLDLTLDLDLDLDLALALDPSLPTCPRRSSISRLMPSKSSRTWLSTSCRMRAGQAPRRPRRPRAVRALTPPPPPLLPPLLLPPPQRRLGLVASVLVGPGLVG